MEPPAGQSLPHRIQPQAITHASSEIARLDRLVADLLVVSGRHPGPRRQTSLGALVRARVEALSPWAGMRKVSIQVQGDAYAMIEAEEYGITSKNVDEMLKSENPSIKRILGVTPGMGKALGVDEKWVYNIVKQVGNYGESFDRNIGKDSALKVERGQNALWTQGGLQYAPPIR